MVSYYTILTSVSASQVYYTILTSGSTSYLSQGPYSTTLYFLVSVVDLILHPIHGKRLAGLILGGGQLGSMNGSRM